MRLLGRKKNKEDDLDDEDEEVVSEKKTVVKKKRRDPDAPEKRKPPKPWGKKERYVLILFLVLTILPSAILAASSRSWKLPGLPRINLSKINLNTDFLSGETIVIEGNPKNPKKAEKFLVAISNMTKNVTGVYGVYVVSMDDGFAYGINETEVFEPASLNKLPVIYAAYASSVDGSLELNTKYSLKESDKIGGAGVLVSQPAGTTYTYQELLELMGKKSDNTAYGIMRRTLGDEKIKDTIDKLGMKNTSLVSNSTTPVDIGNLFKHLFRGYLLDTKHKELFLNSLTKTDYEDWITAGVPTEIMVSHKFAREVNVLNDAGIIFANKPYALVVMSKGVVSEEANQYLPDISRLVYEIETSR